MSLRNPLIFIFCLAWLPITSAYASDEFHYEFGLSAYRLDATFSGIMAPYDTWNYKRNQTAHGWGIYQNYLWRFGQNSEVGLYLQISAANKQHGAIKTRLVSTFFDFGTEIRHHIGNGYFGFIFNLPISRTLWDWDWPTENSTPHVGESPMAPGLVLGYQISNNWSLRLSAIFNQEYVEYRANGDLTTQVAQIKSTRSLLTLVYHLGQKDGAAAAAE